MSIGVTLQSSADGPTGNQACRKNKRDVDQAGPDIVLFFREGLILQIVIPEEPDR